MNLSLAASRYQMTGSRGYHPEEGFKGHDHAPSAPQFGTFKKARINESYPISRMQQQKQLQARDMSLAEEQPALSHSSVLEQSEGSSTFPDAKSGTENKPCRKLKEDAWRRRPKKLREGRILKVASLSNTKGSEKNHVTPTVQMKKAPEEFPVTPSSNFVPSAPRFGNKLQVNTVAKQSHKSVLEMQHSAVQQQTRQASLLEEQAGLVPSQQLTGSLASLSGCEDNMASKIVKKGRYFTSWRPKVVGENLTSREAFIKEVNENDPLTCTHVKGSSKKCTHLPTSSQAAATSDLHVWRNNGRHSVRALYGLPSQQKDRPQPQKGFTLSLEQHLKPHVEGVSTLEHQDRENKEVLDQDIPREPGSLVYMKEKKHVSPWKQAEKIAPLEKTGSPLKCPKQQVHVAKQVESNCSQKSTASNHRPCSTKSNITLDDNQKANPHHQPVSQTSKRREDCQF